MYYRNGEWLIFSDHVTHGSIDLFHIPLSHVFLRLQLSRLLSCSPYGSLSRPLFAPIVLLCTSSALLKPFWDGGQNHAECSRAGWTRETPRAVLASSGLQLLSWLIPTVIFAFLDRCWALSWCFHGTGCHGPGPSSWVGMVSSDPSILHVRLRLLSLTCISSHSPILNFIFTQVSQEATANLHTQPSSSIGLVNLKLALLSTPSLSLVTSESAEQTQLPPTSAKCQDPLTRKACYLLQPLFLSFNKLLILERTFSFLPWCLVSLQIFAEGPCGTHWKCHLLPAGACWQLGELAVGLWGFSTYCPRTKLLLSFLIFVIFKIFTSKDSEICSSLVQSNEDEAQLLHQALNSADILNLKENRVAVPLPAHSDYTQLIFHPVQRLFPLSFLEYCRKHLLGLL